MTTPDAGASLPSVDELTRLANELYGFGAASAPAPVATNSPPPAPASPPAPAVAPRLHAAPSPSHAGAAHPLPGVSASVLDLSRVPLIPESVPAVAPSSAPRGQEAVPAGAGADSVTSHGSLAALDSLAALAVTPQWPFAFPEVPLTLSPHLPSPATVAPRTELPADAGVQSFVSVPAVGHAPVGFDANIARRDFPLLRTTVHGKPLVWLDNAATTQKPRQVIERLVEFYEHENSNIHRAAHTLAARATDAYEGARESVRRFINAASTEEIVFVRGTTEGINLIAKTWGAANIGEGDEILITHLEHHANIVPWQQLCAATGAVLRVAPVDDNGDVIVEEFERLITDRTKIAAFTQVSNALGTVTPAQVLVGIARAHGVTVLLDAAQSIAHSRVDVQALDPDFLVFSGHKIYGPTGIGAVYGKRSVLESMPPWEGGGNMIADVTFDRTLFHGPPTRFEAGTGNIADAVGLGAALDYVAARGIDAIAAYEHSLMDYLVARLGEVRGLRLIGSPTQRAGAVSFVLDGYDPPEVGKALDEDGIAVRSGHHCAQPILRRFGVEATVRPSLALYNTPEDVDALVASLHRLSARRG
ncbi:MAG: cysteine desulfurase [Actinomycetes bacterium]